jgi:hypothetical protein
MFLTRLLSNRMGTWSRTASRKKAVARPRFQPVLEALEHRWVPSTLTVLNKLDTGAGSLRAEIAAAQNGDTIVFAPSLNGQTITLSKTKGELLINKNLTIVGPGADKLTVSGNNTSRVFEVAQAMQLSLSGMTISNGLAQYDNGGGILIDAGAVLTVSNCTLSGNSATFSKKGVGGHAGAIFNTGTATVSGCTLSGNSALGGDSAIYNVGTLTVNSNSAVSGNASIGIANYLGTAAVTSSTVSDNSGQGLYNFGGSSTLMVSDSLLTGNSGPDGGGVYNGGGTASISHCTLSDNFAYGEGGGIYATGGTNSGTLTVSDSILSGNSARDGGGGGIAVIAGIATISDSTLSGNSTDGDWGGGGIFFYQNVTATISHCTLSDNSATLGGGIINYGSLTVSSSTLAGNSATYGGAIYNVIGTVTISDSILGPATINGVSLPGNSASKGGGIYNQGTLTVENSSSITGNTAPVGFGADVYNQGVLYWDLSSGITVLDGNGSVVRI